MNNIFKELSIFFKNNYFQKVFDNNYFFNIIGKNK